jgi:SNF2 family DNA or RNA helicase
MKFIPHEYQKYATQRILNDDAVGLFIQMGLGKTVSVLTAIQKLKASGKKYKILIIAPLRVANSVWDSEIEKWDHLQGLTISKVLGTKSQRIAALKESADIYIINRENTEWLVNFYSTKWPLDFLIIDESSSFKSHKSKRFKAIKVIRKYIKKAVILTGTPAPNKLLDLWSQLYILDEGERLGKYVTHFQDRYFYPEKSRNNIVYSWCIKEMAEQNIYNKISDICVSMKAEDWIKLPEIIYNTVPVSFDNKLMEQYKKFEKDLLLPHIDGDITAMGAAALMTKLLQYSNGAIYNEDKKVCAIHELKLERLEEIIDQDQNVLVFYSYRHDIDRILERFKKAVMLKGNKEINDWNAGKIPILLAHPASCGHGLNLQAGGNIVVWFGLNWSLELYQQANARLYRQGQKENVIIHHIISQGTVDENVLDGLSKKEASQDCLMNALKARINSIKGG